MTPSSSTARKKEEEANESEELRRFREEWKLEVKRRRQEPAPPNPTTSADATLPFASLLTLANPSPASRPSARALPKSVHVTTAPPLSQASSSAVAIYREAVVHEQRGELEEALVLYRAAFRREPNVDRLYERDELLGSILAQQIPSTSKVESRPKVVLAGDGFTLDDLSKRMETTLAVQDAVPHIEHGVVASRTLDSVLHNFPQQLLFQPEDENESVPLNVLPDEIIVNILKILDASSIERFASVNRKARVVSLDSSIWRKLVQETYKSPQVPVLPDGQTFFEYLSEQYLYDFRKLYIEHPRIRLDGVYIAVCHYIRPGLSENSWVNASHVNHLITYHRYLRFFPNGQVISLLTNEEQPPAQVIPSLKPTLRGVKGLFFGNWHLSGSTVVLSNLIDASSRSFTPLDFSSPSSVANVLKQSASVETGSRTVAHHHHHHQSATELPSIRYIFTMNLSLLSRPLGRWNKMDIVSYDSVNLETGDASPVALKHERPFWFSKVKSYAV